MAPSGLALARDKRNHRLLWIVWGNRADVGCSRHHAQLIISAVVLHSNHHCGQPTSVSVPGVRPPRCQPIDYIVVAV